ncbi:MAG: DUF2997 domain-containing protein [Candidatus Lokiarchaeota archaeon]|nr:DUF2997 domain-containing protein [Candidatus Lokiarchaeota archaeon]
MTDNGEITIIIPEDGEVEIQVKNVKGNDCIHLTEFLEKELGEIIEPRQKTPEYFQKTKNISTRKSRIIS